MRTVAIIPAGGKGKRSGVKTPKQYLKFEGKELIVYTLLVFQKNRLVDEIIISAEPEYFDLLIRLKKKYRLTKISTIVEGGAERQDSVFNALNSLNIKPSDFVIVHDAARALLPQNVLTNAITTAKKKGNALVCIKAKDTLIKGKETVSSYLNRDEVYYVQTPQIFKYNDLMKAMNNAYKGKFFGTDESMLVSKSGKKINIVEGSVLNFKITTNEDLEMFKRLIL
jgi:2-C-methyl-D-erythritol 4-phosphate cytidylyltransferase